MYSYYWSKYLQGFNYMHVPQINGLRAITAMGVCKEDDWIAEDPIKPTYKEVQYAVGKSRVSHGLYFRIFSITQIKEILYNNCSAMVTFPIYESFNEASEYGLVPMPSEDEVYSEMHCVALCGYNDNKKLIEAPNGCITGSGFLQFVNSYGENWGENGHGFFSYEFFYEHCHETFCYIPISKEVLNHSTKKRSSFNINQGKVYIRLYEDTIGVSWVESFILLYAYYCNRPIAWIIGSRKGDGMVEITEFFVWPDYRRQGLGSTILRYFIEYVKPNTKRIEGWLSYVDSNWDGLCIIADYYEEFGFKLLEDRNTYKWAKARLEMDHNLT